MSADQARILTELAELVRPLSEGLLPGEEVTAGMTLVGDLGMQSIQLANLSGRIQSRYGASANLVPLFVGKDATSVSEITTGEIADYIARVVGEAQPDEGDGNVRRVAAIMRTGLFDERPPGEPEPENENTAVLAEHAPVTGRTVLRLPRGKVEVFTAGKGPALLLMHPINVGAGVFARLFASLADRYRLVCVHNPGVGATTWDADLTLEGLARLYRTVLTELSIAPPFHVLGSSFGGILAQQFALLHPSECATLVLFGSSYRTAARGGGAAGKTRLLPATVRKEFDRVYADAGGGGERVELRGTRAALREHGDRAGDGLPGDVHVPAQPFLAAPRHLSADPRRARRAGHDGPAQGPADARQRHSRRRVRGASRKRATSPT